MAAKKSPPPRLVFVSHSGEDTWVARHIAAEISARGATPFLDEADVEVGAEFEENIREFLDKADELVVLFTPWALARPYVWAEIGAAWIRRIPIIVVLHGLSPSDFQAQPNAPVFLKKRDIIRLNDWTATSTNWASECRHGGNMAKDHDFELFLSYSRKDLPWVEDFTQALRKAGVRAWFDAAEIPLGERWEKLIQEALRKSQTLIIVLSRNNVGSPWTFFELGAAFADNKRIVPVLMEEVDWQQIPLPLKRYQFLQESSPQIAAQRVAEVLEKQPAATSRSAVGTK